MIDKHAFFLLHPTLFQLFPFSSSYTEGIGSTMSHNNDQDLSTSYNLDSLPLCPTFNVAYKDTFNIFIISPITISVLYFSFTKLPVLSIIHPYHPSLQKNPHYKH